MEQQQYSELLRYLRLIIQKRYLFIPLSLGIMSVIVWGSYLIPKKYEAKSVIFIERNVIEQLVKGIAITPSMDARISVLKDTMLGRSLILNVLRNLDLDTRAQNDKELEGMIVDFQRKTNVRVSNNSLINVSFTHSDPLLAKNYINNLINEYVEKNIFAKREEAYDAAKFLEKQVAFFKGKMDTGEDEIIKFRQKQGIYIALDERSIVGTIKAYSDQIEQMKIKGTELKAMKNSLKRQLEGEEPFTITMFSKGENGGSIEILENRLKQLLVTYTYNYPEVIKLKAQIEVLKSQTNSSPEDFFGNGRNSEISASNPVYQGLKQKLVEVETELNALNAKQDYLTGLIKKKEEELRSIPESKKKLADLEKERDSFKNVYEQLLVRLGQSEVSKQMEIEDKTSTFRIIEPAIMPSRPVSPNRINLILAGIIVGFIGAFGVIFMLDYIDNSVKNLDSLKKFGLPVLAIIPGIQTSEEIKMRMKKDVLLYSLAGIYMLCILGVLAMEYLGLTYVDKFISSNLL